MKREALFKKYYKSKWHDYEITDTLQYKDDTDRSPDICFIYSGRNRGKSFEVTTQLLADAYYDGKCFGYIRRNDVTVQELERYFADKTDFIKDMTDGRCCGITKKQQEIRLFHYEEANGKAKKVLDEVIGFFFYVSSENRFRSLQYPEVENILMEEVMTRGSYEKGEPELVMNLYSTIARHKKVRMWLISNLVTSVNPYSQAWGINFAQNKPGEVKLIKLYTGARDPETKEEGYFLIAAHYLVDKDDLTKEELKPGRNRLKTGIASNKWDELTLYTTLPLSFIRQYKIEETVIFEWDDQLFQANLLFLPENVLNVFKYDDKPEKNEVPVLYIRRKTSEPHFHTRLYTNNPDRFGDYITRGFSLSYKIDLAVDAIWKRGWMIGADNLTMNDFARSFKNLRLMKGTL